MSKKERTQRQNEDHPPTQREILRDVLLCAARLDLWMTLEELSQQNALPADQHFGAVAALAQGGVLIRLQISLDSASYKIYYVN